MQQVTISGVVGRDAEIRQIGQGSALQFPVAVNQGYGQKKSTNWFRCSVWGKRGESIAEYLLKGTKVFLTGELTIGEYQGKPQYDVRVDQVDFFGGEKREAKPEPKRQPVDDLDGDDSDVPF